ncbi:MAG TPA: glycine--tRNA ligase subunit beta, partial [Kofleriaceae bacterium]|nr:glycine--tRNA ligase subunit beta [Kofleriaceae bacterium]
MPPDPSLAQLLVEVGTEEIPAGFLARALDELRTMVPAALAEARLAHGAVEVWGTPRRIAVAVAELADRQPDLSERVVGPPVAAAFDKSGAPTRAALGFAEKNGLAVDQLERAEVPGKKGEYLVGTRREPGKPAREVLPDLIANLLARIPWPKSMRWGRPDVAFVRPVHWLVALYGGEVVPVSFAGVQAGRTSYGHRFLAPGPIELDGSAAGYLDALREAFVIVEPDRRRTAIAAELARVEGETGARVRPDEALIDEVTFLVEYPVAVCGSFSREFLDTPEEVIVSAMRSHQRYFAMQRPDGALDSRFVTIAGTITADPAVVQHGNERVLAARLADAQFFFREDRKVPLDRFAERLSGVVFQKDLGTIGDKVARVRALAGWLAEALGEDAAVASRAAELCKADLVTSMVGEFPDLQGVMGRHYARLSGEPDAVCLAIEEHYLPRGAGGALPQSGPGAVVAIADRLDTLVGCFGVGLAPSGSADPYGLRRAALGVLAILLDRSWSVGLGELVGRALAQLEGVKLQPAGGKARGGKGAARAAGPDPRQQVAEQVLEFFRTRLRGMLADQSDLAADCVDAALAAGFEDVPDARARAAALSRLRA